MPKASGPTIGKRLVEAVGSAAQACVADRALLQTVEGVGQSKAEKLTAALAEARAKVDDELARTAAPEIDITFE